MGRDDISEQGSAGSSGGLWRGSAAALTMLACLVALGSTASGCAAVADAQSPPPSAKLPPAGAIGDLDARRCLAALRRSGVKFSRYKGEGADSVAIPVLLQGPVGGVKVEHARGSEVHSVLDCRLVVALARWSAVLRALDVERIEHYSALRPGSRVRSSGKQSGHAVGLAIDVGRVHLKDGTELDVLEDWKDRRRGADPCPDDEDPDDWKRLRRAVCEAVDRELFQVVLTPHHNRAHRNHVHLEVVPDVDWSYIR